MNMLQDREELHELLGRYCLYADTFQIERVMELWAEDAVFDETRTGTGLHQGHSAIRAFFLETRRILSHMVHLTSNHVIDEISATHATGTCFCHVEALTKTEVPLRAFIYYNDHYIKVAGRWRFQTRVVHPLMPTDNKGYRAEM